MSMESVKQTGRYKLTHQRRAAAAAQPSSQLATALIGNAMRAQRIVDSLRAQIAGTTEEQLLRVRQIFSTPREIYRLEYEVPGMSYQRTTLLDRDALEELLEDDGVRELISRGLGIETASDPTLEGAEPEKEADAL